MCLLKGKRCLGSVGLVHGELSDAVCYKVHSMVRTYVLKVEYNNPLKYSWFSFYFANQQGRLFYIVQKPDSTKWRAMLDNDV